MATQISSSESEARPINYRALNEVLLLGGIAALLFVKWMRGYLDFYIHPRYTALVLMSALILLLMAGVRLRGVFSERRPGGYSWVYTLLALPLLVGVLVPAQPLGAGLMATRDLSAAPALSTTNWQPALDSDTSSWNLLQWSATLSMQDSDVAGDPVNVIGFVFQDEQLGPDHFFVARYVVTCCAADGLSVGLPVIWEGGEALTPDDWVQVEGTLGSMVGANGEQPAIIATKVAPVEQPRNPYLYP